MGEKRWSNSTQLLLRSSPLLSDGLAPTDPLLLGAVLAKERCDLPCPTGQAPGSQTRDVYSTHLGHFSFAGWKALQILRLLCCEGFWHWKTKCFQARDTNSIFSWTCRSDQRISSLPSVVKMLAPIDQGIDEATSWQMLPRYPVTPPMV